MKTSELCLSAGVLAVLTTLGSSLLAVDAVDVQHTVIHYEEGKHCGMPAFHGAQQWHWGNEFLIAYNYSVWAPGTQGDPLKPPTFARLARSTDGGLSWTHYDPPNFEGDGGVVTPPPAEGVDFSAPGFAFKMNTRAFPEDQKNGVYVGKSAFYSLHKGATWKGPFAFPGLWESPQLNDVNGDTATSRTDYIVLDRYTARVHVRADERPGPVAGQGVCREDRQWRKDLAVPFLDRADLGPVPRRHALDGEARDRWHPALRNPTAIRCRERDGELD